MQSSVRAQFITALVLFTIIPLLILESWLSWNNYVLEKEQLIDFQKEAADQAVQLVKAFFHEKEHQLKSIVGTNYLPAMSLETKRELLSRYLHTDKDDIHRDVFTEFSLLDHNGSEVVRVSKKYLLGGELVDRADFEEFTVPFATKKVYFSPIYFDKVSGEPLMMISIPLIELRHQVAVGVLIGEIKLNFLHTIIAGVKIGKTGFAYLTDRDGQVVVHPNPSVVLKRSSFVPPDVATIMPGLSGKKALVVAERMSLGSQKLFCVTEIPAQDAFGNLFHSIKIVLVVLLLSLSGAVTLGFLLMQNFVKPIELLAETATKISQGNFSQKVNLAREDEIGLLATAFDTMTVKLVSTIHELKKEKNFISNAIEALTQPFYVIDADDFTVKIANSAAGFGSLTGRETCYVLNHGLDKPCDDQQNPCPVAKIKKTGKPVISIHSRQQNGTSKTYEVHAYPIFDKRGEVAQIIEYHIDITEKVKLEEQLRHSHKMEAIGTLAGGIAHDFNNILMIINGYAQMVYNEVKSTPSLANDLQEIITAGTRARDLVRQILTISRSTEQEKIPLQLSPVIKEIVKMLRSTIPTTISIEQDIRSIRMVFADPTQIHQVVMNLCTNAYYEMRRTGGTLSILLEDVDITEEDGQAKELAPGRYIKLVIRDTGGGIDENIKNKIFEPYFTSKQIGDGTGLGLAVVHSIIQSYEGHITVDSQEGKGATFIVFLPCYDKDHEDAVEVEETKIELAGTERIMFIDDEEKIISLASKIFSLYGYELETFIDGVEAVKEFSRQSERYDLVITDMTMPKITGTELAQKVLHVRKTIPVILCSGYSDLIDREEALQMGIAEFIEKPFAIKPFLRTVRTLLDRQLK